MQTTSEERRISDWADEVAQEHPLKTRGLVVVIALFLGCAVVVVSGSGMDRLIYGGMAAFIAALAAPLLATEHPHLQGPAKVFKFLVGLVLLLGGLAMIGFGMFLFTAGSFGILASLLFVPIGLAGAVTGWTLLAVRVPNTA